MNEFNRMRQRNYVLSLLNRGYNHDINCIKLNAHSTKEHEFKKFEICWKILKEQGAFLTEANLREGGRADIISMTDDGIKIIEIVKSESEQSLVEKAGKYPKDIKIEIVRC